MDRESINNSILCLLTIGFLLMTSWGNALATMVFGVVLFIVSYFFTPKIARKAILKVAALTGVIAFVVAMVVAILMK
jgi:hypothetical protein